ncbi:hypothetical protein QFC19_006479 [Naganishia cerealis]|uniref:Uncharacterized protein n=1 Tax=Naganishia cerealis TaxID=610337 RepID=A0ACC2VFV6_9TREE|nr:hypothetical protein QFC19_006479 [Naganishia cerealis]
MSSHPRHFEPPPTPAEPLAFRVHLDTSLAHLIRRYPPSSLAPSGGLYAGLLSVVYLFHQLSPLLPPDYAAEGKTLDQWTQAYWAHATTYQRDLLGDAGVEGIKVRPWRCGVGDDALVYAAFHVVFAVENRGSKDNDDGYGMIELEALCRAVLAQVVGVRSAEQERKHGKPASNEWLYGRAGLLYLLRLIRHTVLSKSDDASALDIIDSTIEALVKEILNAPRPWIWHGKAYVGAVHGSAGIIAQLLLSIKAIAGDDGTERKWVDALEADVEQLLGVQFEGSGNWPSSLPSRDGGGERDKLVQFCHGSPGVIACLSIIAPHYPHLAARIDRSISLAQKDLFARGMLIKEPCLCHGATGNALALSGKKEREAFLSFTTEDAVREMIRQGWTKGSDTPEGLYTGLAGRVWVWAIGATRGFDEGRRFPGFDDV